MTNEELIQKFNPAAAGQLTEGDIAVLRGLSTDQIGVLAKAYPNSATQRPYLLLHDSSLADNKQLYPLSTWQNLYNLHKFHSRKNFTPFTFKALYTVSRKAPTIPGIRTAGPGGAKVVDLSSTQAADLLRQNFPGTAAATATGTASTSAKKGSQKPAAVPNPKAPAKGKTVDVARKTAAGKGKAAAPVEADDEEMQDFEESK